MIDEDLYQQAADELNSDKRRPHIWARACALASDDHDEARYLYTNLRVEELIAERDAPPVRSSDPAPAIVEQDNTLALEPVDFADDIPESVSAPSGIDRATDRDDVLDFDSLAKMRDEGEEVQISERRSFQEQFDRPVQDMDADVATDPDSGLDSGPQSGLQSGLDERASQGDPDTIDVADGAPPEDSGLSVDDLDDTVDLTSELDGTAVFAYRDDEVVELLDTDPDAPIIAQPGAGAATAADAEDELDALLGDVYRSAGEEQHPLSDVDAESAVTADFSDITGNRNIIEDELDWLDREITADGLSSDDTANALRRYPAPNLPERSLESGPENSEHDSDRLAQEFERQADELPGQRSEVVAISHRTGKSTATEVVAERDGIDNAIPDAPDMTGPASAATATWAARTIDLPVDLTDQQSGTPYAVYRRGHEAQAVKRGVSWSALFLTLPYLIHRHLFGTAIVYALLWLIVLGGLLVAGLTWLDAGQTATPAVKIATGGFALLALAGLFYMPFRHGNRWREAKLERRGFELVARVRASSPGKALSEARRAAALD